MKKLSYLLFLFLFIAMLFAEGEKNLTPKWSLELEKEIHALYSTDNFILVGLENSLLALDKKGRRLWNYSTPEEIIQILVNQDKILAASPHHFYLFDLQGKLKLEKELNSSWIFYKSISLSQENIAVGSMDGYLHFYNFDGKEKWKHKLDAYLLGVKILDKRVIGISDKQIYIFDREGNLKKKLRPSSKSYIQFAFIDSKIGISLGNNFVEVYNQEGKEWSQKFPDKIGAIIIQDSKIALGSKDGFLYLFDLKRDLLRWQKKLSGPVKKVQLSGNKIIAFTLDNTLYLFNLQGNQEGKISLNSQISTFSSSSQDFLIASASGKLFYFPLFQRNHFSLFILILLLFGISFLMVMFLRALSQ